LVIIGGNVFIVCGDFFVRSLLIALDYYFVVIGSTFLAIGRHSFVVCRVLAGFRLRIVTMLRSSFSLLKGGLVDNEVGRVGVARNPGDLIVKDVLDELFFHWWYIIYTSSTLNRL
jgi:hypothetical protein